MRISAGRKKIRLGDLLVAAGAITEEELQEVEAYGRKILSQLTWTLILGAGLLDGLNLTISQQLGIDYIELKSCKLTDDVLRLIPEKGLFVIGRFR